MTTSRSRAGASASARARQLHSAGRRTRLIVRGGLSMLAAAFGWWLAGWQAALILAAVAAVADTVRVARTWSDAEPARASIEELLPEILDGTLQPGKVFDRTVSLDEVPAGYQAMADREALKVLIKP